jgi:hypothetical protein
VVDIGSVEALAAQDVAALAAPGWAIHAVGQEVEGTWDPRAAALFFTRSVCNASCVRRARRRLARLTEETEAVDRPGPLSPWRPPPALIRMQTGDDRWAAPRPWHRHKQP